MNDIISLTGKKKRKKEKKGGRDKIFTIKKYIVEPWKDTFIESITNYKKYGKSKRYICLQHKLIKE